MTGSPCVRPFRGNRSTSLQVPFQRGRPAPQICRAVAPCTGLLAYRSSTQIGGLEPAIGDGRHRTPGRVICRSAGSHWLNAGCVVSAARQPPRSPQSQSSRSTGAHRSPRPSLVAGTLPLPAHCAAREAAGCAHPTVPTDPRATSCLVPRRPARPVAVHHCRRVRHYRDRAAGDRRGIGVPGDLAVGRARTRRDLDELAQLVDQGLARFGTPMELGWRRLEQCHPASGNH